MYVCIVITCLFVSICAYIQVYKIVRIYLSMCKYPSKSNIHNVVYSTVIILYFCVHVFMYESLILDIRYV